MEDDCLCKSMEGISLAVFVRRKLIAVAHDLLYGDGISVPLSAKEEEALELNKQCKV